jgi:transcriptional regulator with XRE-family HTH domain
MKGFTYKSYSFTDKDPIIDEIRTVVQDSGVSYRQIEEESGVTSWTLRSWFDGKTRRPQAATLNAVARALGYKLGFVPYKEAAVAKQPPASLPGVSTAHVVRMAKIRRRDER